MFRSATYHTIDDKGRIKIPSRFRDAVKAGGVDGVVVTQMDQSLFAYVFDEWRKIEARINAVVEKNNGMRRFRRIFVGGASECLCDRQGRILIPPPLREYAQLEKDIVLAGVTDHFEIWSKGNWDKEKALLEKDMQKEEIQNEVAKLGL
jgi:MraZ protein